MTDEGSGGARQEWRLHWRTAAAATIVIAFSFQTFQASSSLFVVPLQEAFGWSRSEIAFTQNAYLGSAVAALLIGRAVDYWTPRKVILVCMAGAIIAYLALAAMNGSLALFYVLYLAIAVTAVGQTGLTCARVISESFDRSRGLALGISRGGVGLLAAVLPTALFLVISAFGWRAGYVAQATIVMAAVPAALFWIGRAPGRSPRPPAKDVTPPSYLSLLANWRVTILCLAAALAYAPGPVLLTQLQPLLIDKALDPAVAAGLIGLVGVSSLTGAIITGVLIDRFWAPAMALLFAVGAASGIGLLAFSTTVDAPTAAIAIILVGFAMGAEVDILAFLVARYFGIAAFSSVYGIGVFAIAAFTAAGGSLVGVAYDLTGSYDFALVILAGCVVGGGLLYLTLGRYPDRSHETRLQGQPAIATAPSFPRN